MTILAPSATKISAVRQPMPLVAPVITATLPSSLPMSFSWFCRNGIYLRLADATQATLEALGVRILPHGEPDPGYADRLA
jgi:hypothetical protein